MASPTEAPEMVTDKTRNYLFTPTQDWFSFNMETWRKLFPLVTSKAPRVLEIGSWEGRSATFLLDELCREDGSIVCIDHFDLMRSDAGQERYRKVTHNLAETGKTHRILDHFSFPALMILLEEEMSSAEPGFDWVYVDGSHEADDTFLDGELAWRLARKGAVFIFDDYDWNVEPHDSRHHPKRGIDAFLSLHDGDCTRLSSPSQYQMILQKTSDMRIGFLVKEKSDQDLARALGYGINIVYAIDSGFSMPTAVSIRSILEHTEERLTVYIIDCGLADDDKSKLRDSLPLRENFGLVFLDLPSGCLTRDAGVVWTKLEIAAVVPVERVLYLDGDTLLRADIKRLWDEDLGDSPLAAVRDVGYPMGHGAETAGPYFNAGVLLMDLAKIRETSAELRILGEAMTKARYKDQDVLNIHFSGKWHELSLKWNAQGLGTYSQSPTPERNMLRLEEMRDPCLVHFTGPVHPALEIVLNPWVQPYTAKPWGYAGAPGHPFAEEWWQVLDKTAWKGYRDSIIFRSCRNQSIENAIQQASIQLKQKVETTV